MRILVSGATGFLGLGLCRRLIEQGAHVRALVRPGRKTSVLEELGVEVAPGDLRDTWSLAGVAQGIDTVIHAGAVHRGGRLTRADFWQVNSEGTRRLLQEAVAGRVRRFVYVSTAGVHGDVGASPAGESRLLGPHDLYTVTKLRGEQAVRRIAHSDGIEFAIIRPSTIYGPGDQRFLKLFRTIANHRFVLIGSGKTLTHLVYVDDAIAALLRACEDPAASGETFLVAGPRITTMRELIQATATALGVAPPQLRVPYVPVWVLAHGTAAVCRALRIEPPLYPRRLAFFSTNRAYRTDRIRERLGFVPTVDLEEGLERTVGWFREHGLL